MFQPAPSSIGVCTNYEKIPESGSVISLGISRHWAFLIKEAVASLFAYSKGITSSREIQWCCETNIIFKALSCDTVPHFTTLAKFVSSHAEEIEELFEQVLLVCHEQGLLGNELFAIDVCKMSSNAAKERSGTLKELGEKREAIKNG